MKVRQNLRIVAKNENSTEHFVHLHADYLSHWGPKNNNCTWQIHPVNWIRLIFLHMWIYLTLQKKSRVRCRSPNMPNGYNQHSYFVYLNNIYHPTEHLFKSERMVRLHLHITFPYQFIQIWTDPLLCCKYCSDKHQGIFMVTELYKGEDNRLYNIGVWKLLLNSLFHPRWG